MRLTLVLAIVSIFWAAQSVFAAAAGKYTDGQLTIDLNGNDTLNGAITLGSNQFPATAHVNGNKVDGSFTASGAAFPFNATLDGDTLTLTSGGKTYSLKRLGAPANPLSGAAPAASGDLISGYSVVTSTEFGKSLFTSKPDATSVTAALGSAVTDLSHYFDGKPDIKGAYENAEDHKSGGAIFAATLKGQPMKGVISCKMLDKGAGITVAYCKTDAPQTEWAKLSAAPPAPANGGDASAQPASNQPAAPPLDPAKILGADAQVIQFPDGTGSITIPAGWTPKNAQSATAPILIQGPADQSVLIGAAVLVNSKDSFFVKNAEQQQARMRQMGMNPPPPPPMIIAEFTDPVQAMQDIWPQITEMSQKRGATQTFHLDQILDHKDIPAPVPNGKAAIIKYLVTRTEKDGSSRQIRGAMNAFMFQAGTGNWTFVYTAVTAPKDTFDNESSKMFAVVQSEKVNAQAIQQIQSQQAQQGMDMIRAQGQANAQALKAQHDAGMQQLNSQYANHQAYMDQQNAQRDDRNAQFNSYENNRSRMKDNQVEQILGYREVYDTQTGLSANVDLNDVNGVVNSLNDAALDPHRFVQIPLRDIQDPR